MSLKITLLICLAILSGCGIESGYIIKGDLGEFASDGEVVLTQFTSLLGESEQFASVPIENGQFQVRGETWGPRLIKLKVLVDDEVKGSVRLIIEPGETLHVTYVDWITGLVGNGGDYHHRLLSSWRDSAENVEALARYRDVMTRKREFDDREFDDSQSGSDAGEALSDEAWQSYEALQTIEKDALQALVSQNEDPLASFLAMELGGRDGDVLARLKELEPHFSAEMISQQFLPMQRRAEARAQIALNSAGVETGTLAEDFSAPDLDGELVSLYDVLAENELVLIDFWASWCGPCIVQFPHLVTLRERFHDRGFEIIGFSVDGEALDWREASEEHALPWINLSDDLALSSPVSIQFGVTVLPQNYLLDTDGLVLARGLTPDELEAELVARLHEPVNK